MKRVFYSLIVVGVMLLSACSSYNYYKAGASTISTTKYRTFAWVKDEKQSNPKPDYRGKQYAGNMYYNNSLAAERIKEATILTLQSKGLKLDNEEPDLLVHYSSAVGRGTRMEYYSPYSYYWGGGFYRPYWGGRWGWGWGWPYGGYAWGPTYAVPENYKEGTIIIDLIDRKSNKIVWRGFGVGELKNPEKALNDLPKVIDGIFKQLPITM
ncbi:DUF4136 domain-containing protein [Mucilaginibacter sp. RS28]|uniref:DUF4136 domain-containing protein n=1 Tax=Mucilaginibacter straminoryzae TaxID=2932774 RepID=A0A9X2BDI7_9SPHI|nr:DUF4136 domain-containing protein [Mucilaginibacter straminoryzae]MCJ8210378.1 DUF4136 domain-containing protein [Mucilaginibacter straminoryzae]